MSSFQPVPWASHIQLFCHFYKTIGSLTLHFPLPTLSDESSSCFRSLLAVVGSKPRGQSQQRCARRDGALLPRFFMHHVINPETVLLASSFICLENIAKTFLP